MPNTTDVASSWAIVAPPARRMASEALRAVAAHPGEQACERVGAAVARDRLEQHVDGRPAAVPLGTVVEPEGSTLDARGAGPAAP